jgi:1-acyl-sn-glycerol-3-phosphate acyltransferase
VLPNCDCIVKEGILKNPFMRGVAKAADYLVNSQAETMIETCRQRLDEGGVILIFPEGTRSVPGQSVKLQRGAAHIAVRCRRDIRIVRIQCSQGFLYKNTKWYKIPPKKPFFTVEVKNKIQVEEFSIGSETSTAIFARRLTGYLTEALT